MLTQGDLKARWDERYPHAPLQQGYGLTEASGIAKPLMLHIASKDQFVPPEAQEQVKAALADNPRVTAHVYEGQDHAFAREGGDHYDAAAATLANDRTLGFFKEHLAP